MTKKTRVFMDYNDKGCKSKKALLESILADIEESKTQNREYLELEYTTYPEVSRKQREANTQAIESVIGELVTDYNYSVQNKGEHNRWIIYWGDSPPDFS